MQSVKMPGPPLPLGTIAQILICSTFLQGEFDVFQKGRSRTAGVCSDEVPPGQYALVRLPLPPLGQEATDHGQTEG